jgi:2-keto-4-pentenoate hydratase/2-oxohepta-3-ene-1,7-dioic acid hydratase in catechol pathway
MKLSLHGGGPQLLGVATTTGVIDMGHRLGGKYPSLRAPLAGDGVRALSPRLQETPTGSRLRRDQLLPPIPDPDKIICLGNNYCAHVLEGGNKIPEHPQLFIRLANSLVGHEAPIIVPKISHELDYEVELAVVIGRGGRHIAKARALEHVAGYTCFHDASVRDIQLTHCLDAGKNFLGTGPCGPWLVTRDEIAGPASYLKDAAQRQGAAERQQQRPHLRYPDADAYISRLHAVG